MAIRTYDILLDEYNSTIPEPIIGRQGDKDGAVLLHVTITDHGTAVDLTGQTINLMAETANGSAIVADNLGVTLTDAKNGKFDYAIPKALWSESGKITKAYFSLSNSDGQQTTYDLIFIVKKAIGISQDEADDYIAIIDGTLRDLNAKVDDLYAKYKNSGNPRAIESEAVLKETYPNGNDGVFVALDTGHMWMYDYKKGNWIDGGAYQSMQIKDRSITINKLAGEAIPVTFVPSRDGLVNYNTSTSTIDFNCITDNAYVKYYDHYVRIPSNQTLVINTGGRSSGYISIDIDTGVPTLVNVASNATAENSTVLGYYRIFPNLGNKIAFYGAIAESITVDGHRNAANITPGEGIMVAFSPSEKPNFDTSKLSFDFCSKVETKATIYFEGGQHSIPAGKIATPSKTLADIGTLGSVKIGYKIATDEATVFSWNETLPDGYIQLGMIQRGYGGFSSTLDCTVDGVIAPNDNPIFTPSKDGNPWIDFDRKVIDFNCVSDSAYIRYNQKIFPLPKGFTLDVAALLNLSLTSFIFVFRPVTGLIDKISWSNWVPDGTFLIGSIRATNNGGYKTTGIPVDYLGFGSNEVPIPDHENIQAIAHRGYNVIAPEESKAAYICASQNGYRHWEGDVHFTSDGVPVMHHDETINRIARNADGSVIADTVTISQTSLAQLDTYDFGISKSPNYAGTKILRFADFVNLARRYDAYIHPEIKEAFTRDQKKQLLDIVKKERMTDRTGWQAFDWTQLKDIKELSPTSQLELLGPTVFDDDFFAKFASYQTSTNNVVVSVGSGVSIADIQTLIDRDIDVYVWTVDDQATARRFASVAVKGLLTNGGINIHSAIRMP